MQLKDIVPLTAVRRSVAAGVTAALLGFASVSSASAVITDVQLIGGDGSIGSLALDDATNTLSFIKTFEGLSAMTIRFTIAHGTGSGGPFEFVETIRNATGINWTDYHISTVDDQSGNRPVITSFNQSSLSGFTLDADSNNGLLNFTGSLAFNNAATATFKLNFSDPGAGNSYTADLIQLPTAVPVPMAVYLFVPAIAGLAAFKRKRSI